MWIPHHSLTPWTPLQNQPPASGEPVFSSFLRWRSVCSSPWYTPTVAMTLTAFCQCLCCFLKTWLIYANEHSLHLLCRDGTLYLLFAHYDGEVLSARLLRTVLISSNWMHMFSPLRARSSSTWHCAAEPHDPFFPLYPAKDELLSRFEEVKILWLNFWLETVSDHVNVYFLTVDCFNFQINPFNLNDEEIQLGPVMKDESLPVSDKVLEGSYVCHSAVKALSFSVKKQEVVCLAGCAGLTRKQTEA